jgi:hypothetical protein
MLKSLNNLGKPKMPMKKLGQVRKNPKMLTKKLGQLQKNPKMPIKKHRQPMYQIQFMKKPK